MKAREIDEHFKEVAEGYSSREPPDFTDKEHELMLRAIDRLLHNRYPLVISSNYGESLISLSGLTSDKIRLWLRSMDYHAVKTVADLEVWELGKVDEEKSCGSCSVALKGDRSAIKCNSCRYLAKSCISKSEQAAIPMLVYQAGATPVKDSA